MMAKYNYPSELRSIPFNEMNAKIVSEAAQKGDMIAINTFKYTGKMLGEALANAVAITSHLPDGRPGQSRRPAFRTGKRSYGNESFEDL